MSEAVRTEYDSELDGDLGFVYISRPERRNALDSATARALADALREACARARVVILTGEGGAFSAGGDLEELERWSDLDPNEISTALYDSFQAVVRAIRAGPAVVIAAIGGAAVGAGLDIALACDLRVAAEDAKLGQVWVRLGVIPGTGGAWLTQAIVGQGRAAELLLTGDVIDAARALELGLVNEVVATGSLLDAARALAERILAHPPDGVVANKRALNAATEEALERALQHAAKVQPERFTSEEFRKAVRAARR